MIYLQQVIAEDFCFLCSVGEKGQQRAHRLVQARSNKHRCTLVQYAVTLKRSSREKMKVGPEKAVLHRNIQEGGPAGSHISDRFKNMQPLHECHDPQPDPD